ncbi:hypothetical protein VaNZ11_000576 [Volvox africanus]|uniref:RNB domain-containing protein n=1 Tax=Volvox africanus TaxID=51714 RepID=A0ABQ5RMM6_9CHLO|nr:hypothetical protein VaNZ11_000576 [Volvox africanus]
MSRATAHSAGMLVPDPPALRAPSRGRRAQQPLVRSYGAGSANPFSGVQHSNVHALRHSTSAGTVQTMAAVATATGRRASAAGRTDARSGPTRRMRGWETASVPSTRPPNAVSIMRKKSQPQLTSASAAAASGCSAAAAATTAVASGHGWPAGGLYAVVAAAAPRRNIPSAVPGGGDPTGAARGFNLSTYPSSFHADPTPLATHHVRHQRPDPDPHVHRGPHMHQGTAFGGSQRFPTRTQRLAEAGFRLQAAKSSGAAAFVAGQTGALQAGSLVEYEKNDRGVLAVLAAPDGKKNWFAVDQTGRRQSITPKQVQWVLPGGGYKEADVVAFTAAAEGADMTLMEIAWEVAAESGEPLELRDLAILLYDDMSPKSLYVTHRMLQRDTLYFKPGPRGGSVRSYVPRSAEDVAALRQQQEAAEGARKAAEAWRVAVTAARAAKTRSQLPSAVEWQSGPFADRIAALMAIALSALPRVDDVTMQLALASLQLAGAGSRAEPDVAAALLVEIGALRRHEPLQLLRRGLALQTPPEQQEEALAMLSSPPADPDASSREDLTRLTVFTIDDASTTEVDDGLSLEHLPGGAGIRIWIHVADPTRWIRPGSNLDVAGRERIRTLYLPWGSVPMFPRQLAEGPFSLREGQLCEAMSVCVLLNKDGSLERPRVLPSRVRVSHKLTYDQADAVLAAASAAAEAASEAGTKAAAADGASNGLDAAAAADLVALRDAALSRRAYREARGCIEIPLPEAQIHVPYAHLDRARPSVNITRISQWDSASRGLVAEMMILAGEAIGTIGAEAALPLPYRGQVDPPDLPSTKALAALPEGPCRGFALKRCMTRSSVAATPQRHASLALDAYVQFTSPIRRYVDMLAHHNLKAWLRGEPLPFSRSDIDALVSAGSDAARELGAAERESENYWIAEYLRLNWGTEYPAMVLGWQREDLQLAAFLLEREGLEVVARVPQGSVFNPGDCCVLVPTEVSPTTGFYRFYVAGWTSGLDPERGEGEDEEGGEQDWEEAKEDVVVARSGT